MPAPMLALADDLAVAATALEDEVLRLTLVMEDAALVLPVAILAALAAFASFAVIRASGGGDRSAGRGADAHPARR